MPLDDSTTMSRKVAIEAIDEAFKGALSNLFISMAAQVTQNLPISECNDHLKRGLRAYFQLRNMAVDAIVSGEVKP